MFTLNRTKCNKPQLLLVAKEAIEVKAAKCDYTKLKEKAQKVEIKQENTEQDHKALFEIY